MKMARNDVEKLRELRRLAAFEKCSFGMPSETVIASHDTYGDPEKINKDAFIKEATRLYRESWLLPIIDELLAKYDR